MFDTLEVNRAVDLLTEIGHDTTLKRVAATNGGEYAGPCPFCGGDDRFRVWPALTPARWWCRVCGRSGDAIAYLTARDGLTFRQVCQRVGQHKRKPLVGQHKHKPRVSGDPPPADWQAAALALLGECEAALWADQGRRALDWLRNERKLSDDTIRAWRLGYCPADGQQHGLYCDRGIVIPWLDTQGRLWKLSVRRPAGRPKYRAVRGSTSAGALFGADKLTGRPDLFVVEGEFDTILLWQAVNDVADVLTLGSESARLADRWLPALLAVRRFWICTDADAAGERAARHWLAATGERGQRVYPPAGEKDVTDAARAGADLRRWALALLTCPDGQRRGGDVAELEDELDALLAEMQQAAQRHRRGELNGADYERRIDELQTRFASLLDAHQAALEQAEARQRRNAV